MNNQQFKILLALHLITLLLVGTLFYEQHFLPAHSGQEISVKTPERMDKIKVDYNKNYVYGDLDAKNELVVFSGYGCNYCQQFYQEMFGHLKEKFIKTGILKVVFMVEGDEHNHLEYLMDKAAELARREGLFEEVQASFYGMGNFSDSVQIMSVLTQRGMDQVKLAEDWNKPELNAWLAGQKKERDRLQIHAMPTFVLNGEVLVGYTGRTDFLNFYDSHIIL